MFLILIIAAINGLQLDLRLLESIGYYKDVGDQSSNLNIMGNMYMTTIYFAGQPKDLLVDTGSSWTWVQGFDRDASITLRCTNQTKFIQYGIGQINGEICYDYVGLYDNFTANMPFLLVD